MADVEVQATLGHLLRSGVLATRGARGDAAGLQRKRSGLSIEQRMAEHRALRSSVLRLWCDRCTPGDTAIAEIGRFNEAIDQAIAT